MTTLRLPSRMNEILSEHLRRAYPEEGCGVMLGRERGDVREVDRLIPIENRREDSRERRYLIAPEQFLAADRESRALGLEVIGVFHSHPDHPARPSAFDLEHAWPYYSYVIVSLERGRVADATSWRLREDRSGFESETLELVPDANPGHPGDRNT
jgi:proteasome lid subunit RPN8/RPN11